MTNHTTIVLPASAKFFSCKVDTLYNSNYDIIWSFKYSISGVQPEYGIGTALTCVSSGPNNYNDSPLAGQYLCSPLTNTSSSTPIINILSGADTISLTPYNLISVCIDTTGTCGLSSAFRPGVATSSLSANAITVRDIANNVIFYQSTSSLVFDTDQNHIIRCIYSNSNQTLQVDYRNESVSTFSTIALCNLNYVIINDNNLDLVSPRVTFCSPISSLQEPCSLYLYNVHHEGVKNNTSVELLTSTFIA